jgi:hypothetical protein
MQHRRTRLTTTGRRHPNGGSGKVGFSAGADLAPGSDCPSRVLARTEDGQSNFPIFPPSIFAVGKSGFFRRRGSLHRECLSSRVKWLPVPSPSREGRRRGIQFPDFPTLDFRGREKRVFPSGVPPPGMPIRRQCPLPQGAVGAAEFPTFPTTSIFGSGKSGFLAGRAALSPGTTPGPGFRCPLPVGGRGRVEFPDFPTPSIFGSGKVGFLAGA